MAFHSANDNKAVQSFQFSLSFHRNLNLVLEKYKTERFALRFLRIDKLCGYFLMLMKQLPTIAPIETTSFFVAGEAKRSQ